MQSISYDIVSDDQTLTITLARTPIIPVRQMLAELIFFWAAIFVLVMASSYVSRDLFVTLWLFAIVPIAAGMMAALWNTTMGDLLRLDGQQLLFVRHFAPFRTQTAVPLTDIRSIRGLQKKDRLAATAVPGLRLLLLNVAGQLVIETGSGKLIRFGWNLNPVEMREVIVTLRKWTNAHTPSDHPRI